MAQSDKGAVDDLAYAGVGYLVLFGNLFLCQAFAVFQAKVQAQYLFVSVAEGSQDILDFLVQIHLSDGIGNRAQPDLTFPAFFFLPDVRVIPYLGLAEDCRQ
jgi:hypothetical protein